MALQMEGVEQAEYNFPTETTSPAKTKGPQPRKDKKIAPLPEKTQPNENKQQH